MDNIPQSLSDDREAMEAMKPHKTWFIERGDGYIFASREVEAWNLMKNRTNWMRQDFKIIGTSDGTTYHKIVRDSQQQMPLIQGEINRLQKDLEEYTNTENHLKFKELAEPTDERLIKVKKLKADLVKEIQAKMSELNEITKNVHQKAFDAELEEARKHPEFPTNQDVVTPGGNREKIMATMGK